MKKSPAVTMPRVSSSICMKGVLLEGGEKIDVEIACCNNMAMMRTKAAKTTSIAKNISQTTAVSAVKTERQNLLIVPITTRHRKVQEGGTAPATPLDPTHTREPLLREDEAHSKTAGTRVPPANVPKAAGEGPSPQPPIEFGEEGAAPSRTRVRQHGAQAIQAKLITHPLVHVQRHEGGLGADVLHMVRLSMGPRLAKVLGDGELLGDEALLGSNGPMNLGARDPTD